MSTPGKNIVYTIGHSTHSLSEFLAMLRSFGIKTLVYLKAKGWTVLHIMGVNKAEEHSYTSPASVIGGRGFYADKDLFNQ